MFEQSAEVPATATKVLYLSIEQVQRGQRQRALPYPAPPTRLHPGLERPAVG